MNTGLVATIASYGHRYREEYLSQLNPATLLENWWAALDFFFSRACYQGTLDTVSERVYKAVRETLASEFKPAERTENYERLRQHGWRSLEYFRRGRGVIANEAESRSDSERVWRVATRVATVHSLACADCVV